MADTTLLNQPIVIDNGSGTIKAGFAGEEKPKHTAPALIGWPKYQKVMAGALEGDVFIGTKALEHRGLLRLRHPMSHGIIEHWDDMELLWGSVLQQELKISIEDHPVLLTEAPLNPKRNRERSAQVFFETFGCPALYLGIQAVLALYASGRTTGVVLDSGDGVTHVVPVYDGFSLSNAVKRVDIAGRDVTEQLQFLLRKQGVLLDTSAEKEVVRLIKEKTCFVSLDPSKDERDWHSYSLDYDNSNNSNEGPNGGKTMSYRLPDGQVIDVGAERFRAPEVLFRPEIIGSESLGVSSLVFDSIQRVDMDLRSSLYQSVVLSGGSTLMKGFGDRLLSELKSMTPRGNKIKIYAPPERKYSTWIGGSILAGLSTFKKMWVSRSEWDENPDLIHTKCL